MNSPSITYLKGAIGTFPPIYALLFHIDSWAAPAQVCLGAIVPTLMGVSLLFDIKKKWKDNRENERQDYIRKQRAEYFRNKRLRKKHVKPKFVEKDDGTIDPIDPSNFM